MTHHRMHAIGMMVVAFAMVLVCSVPSAEAQKRKEKEKEKETAISPDLAKALAERSAREASAKAKLDGTVWGLELTVLSGEKTAKPKRDTLRFEGGKVRSDALLKEGYLATNYTVTVSDESAPIVWETMQTKEGGVVFWRGEWQGETMRGIFSRRSDDGTIQDFSFVGTLVERATPPPPAQPVATVGSPVSPGVEGSASPPTYGQTVETGTPHQLELASPTETPSQPSLPAASTETPSKQPKKKGWWR